MQPDRCQPSWALFIPQVGLAVTLRLAGARLVVRDVLRRPLAELEMGEALAVMRRVSASILHASLSLHVALWCTSAPSLLVML